MSSHFWCGWCARRMLSSEGGHELIFELSVYGKAPCPGGIPCTFPALVLSLPMPSKNLVLTYQLLPSWCRLTNSMSLASFIMFLWFSSLFKLNFDLTVCALLLCPQQLNILLMFPRLPRQACTQKLDCCVVCYITQLCLSMASYSSRQTYCRSHDELM